MTGTPVQSDGNVKILQDQVSQLTSQIESLTKLMNQQRDPTLKQRAEGNVSLSQLDSVELLSEDEIRGFEVKKSEAIRELNGVRKTLMSSCGGAFKAMEYQTGDDSELKKRVFLADKAIHLGTVGNLSDVEKDRLLKEYKELTEELKQIVPSHSDQWQVNGEHYQEAVEKCQMMMGKYAGKIRRWKNIAKILYPEDKKKWDEWALSK
jgi:hypothetical protein